MKPDFGARKTNSIEITVQILYPVTGVGEVPELDGERFPEKNFVESYPHEADYAGPAVFLQHDLSGF